MSKRKAEEPTAEAGRPKTERAEERRPAALNGPQGRPLRPGESTVVVGAGAEPKRPGPHIAGESWTLENALNVLVPNRKTRYGEVEDPQRGAFVVWANGKGYNYMSRERWRAAWAEFQTREV